MDKPERVEAGQWWCSNNDADCFRVEGIAKTLGEDWALHGNGKFASPCGQLLKLSTCEYLGSGDHPEPSEWIIETLARHAFEVVCAAKDPSLDVPWDDKDEYERRYYAEGVRDALACNERSKHLVLEFKRATLSLYRILRSLGKW